MLVKISAVYCIKNLVNGKVYVGQSEHIYSEWAGYRSALRHNKHVNSKLQLEWNEYGEENFKHIILEECPKERLGELEKYYIEKFKSTNIENGYNTKKGGKYRYAGYKMTPEQMENRSDTSGENHYNYGKRNVNHPNFGKKYMERSSEYYGVYAHREIYWQARISIDNKTKYLGNFSEEKDAAIAYDNYVIKNNLPHNLNFPPET